MATTPLDNLKKKRDQLNARIQKMEAFKKSKARKQDTRRKILIGAYTLAQAKKNESQETLYQNVLGFLSRESDKKLFEWAKAHGV